ncbi:MAG TPA: hypothetical protein VF823_01000, partial [Anaerolineales bacterium]
RDAVIKGELPLHMPDGSALRNVTDRYLALPDVMLVPQMVLLRFMDVGRFILANTLFLYTLGVLGLLWFWRRYSLSPLVFAVLLLLFNLNGHILSHFSVGHVNYGGYFLFPWLLALILVLLESTPERRPGWGWVAAFAFIQFFILLNGSFHQYIWMLMLLGLVGLFSWKHLPLVFKGIVFTGLLGAFRLLPPALELGKFDNEFLGGYPSVGDLWTALTSIRLPADSLSFRSILTTLGWWEFDLYVGLVGAAFLIVFGLYYWGKNRGTREGYPELILPVVLLFAFSIGRVYEAIHAVPIPLLNGERVSARLIIVPFVVILLLGSVYFQRWLETHARSTIARWSLAVLLLPLLNDLYAHLRAWRVNVAVSAFPNTPTDLAIKVVKNHVDAPYTTMLWIGGAVTLLTAVFLITMAVIERRKRQV